MRTCIADTSWVLKRFVSSRSEFRCFNEGAIVFTGLYLDLSKGVFSVGLTFGSGKSRRWSIKTQKMQANSCILNRVKHSVLEGPNNRKINW
jgi:hypothetical protein